MLGEARLAARPPIVGPVADAAVTGVATGVPGAGATVATVGVVPPPTGVPGVSISGGPLGVGHAFGARYTLIRLLGAGGMGAVYQAWDQELGVVVAIKVIRPEAMADPTAARDLERRFKRELLLARNVTHKNVVRIHDIGEVEGIKYITMPYVHGGDLGTLIKRSGRLTVPHALAIAKQIAAGLAAAHEAGIVHRDLKPANIMLDEEDHALITDFGIARSTSSTAAGATVPGAVVGTLDYMAPEQARGEAVDHRADIYAFGLILSDMLISRPMGSDQSVLAALMTRITTPLPPINSIDPQLPQALSDIVSRCTTLDPAARYQQTKELLADLEGLDANGHLLGATQSTTTRPWSAPPPVAAQTWRIPKPQLSWPWLAGGLALALAVAGFLVRDRIFTPRSASAPVAQGESISLAIVPFRNASPDRTLDWLGPSLADMLRSEIGQSAALRTVPSERTRQILNDLRISADSVLDPATLGRLAEFSSADTVMWGQYLKFGNEIRIDATIQDVKHQRTLPVTAQARNENELLAMIGQLAASVREKLFSPEVAKNLKQTSFRPSSSSLPALRFYNEGLALVREGKYLDAVKKFEASTQEDKNFALAYAKLAQAYSQLGYAGEAERFSRTSVSLSETLPAAEKYLIQGNSARILNDHPKAIDAYEKVASALPGNDEVLFDLAGLYEEAQSFDQARDRFTRLVQRDPKAVDALIGLGRVELGRGNPQAGLESFGKAMTLAVQRENDEAKATALRYTGLAYRLLNKPDEALRNLNESLEISRRIGQKREIAATVNELGNVLTDQTKLDLALKRFEEALAIRKEIGDRQGVGETLMLFGNVYWERGQYDQALASYKESLQIHRDKGNARSESAVLSNMGAVYFLKGDYESSLTYLRQALTIREKLNNPSEISETVYNLAETSLRMGRYEDSLQGYMRVLGLVRGLNNKKMAAYAQFSMSVLYGYQGRFGAALASSKEAADVYSGFDEKSTWTIVILNAYGHALSQIGRSEEAQPILDKALALARELKNGGLVAEALNYQGDTAFYRGDFKAARALYEQALQAASRSSDSHVVLLSKVNLGMVGSRDGRARAAVTDLNGISAEADRQGLKYLSVVASISLAEALVVTNQDARAQQELDRALTNSEKLGLKVQLAQAHHLMAALLRKGGNAPDARRHEDDARRIVEEIRQEAKTDAVLKRADLAPIVETKQ